MERTNRSQWALRLGLRGGRTTGSTPLPLSKPSNAWVNLVSRSWMQILLPQQEPVQGVGQLPGTLLHEGAVGCGVIPAI